MSRSWVRSLSAAALVVHFLFVNYKKNVARTLHKPSHHDLPPIYWINLDISTTRRDAMLSSFSSLGIFNNHFRISAYDNVTSYDLWHSGQLILHPKIRLEAKTELPTTLMKHINNIYHYEEAACLLSHLHAIKQAYEAGHELALFLEDDALLSSTFIDNWRNVVDKAPKGWKILQFATMMPVVMKQGVRLLDPFVSWQPYHWSTRAYMINRAGMQTLADKAYSTSLAGKDVWRVEEAPVVVSDEVLYAIIGDAHTSTGLWIDSFEVNSTIQSDTKNSDIMHSYSSSIVRDSLRREINYDQAGIFEDSLIVLMNVRISKKEEIKEEINRIKQDSHDVCKFHRTCKWEINVVVVHQDLVSIFQETASSELPSNVETLIKVSTKPFSKFEHVQKSIDQIARYDLLLLKDNDQRISGFPWRTFVRKRGNATVSGPLRQNMNAALLGNALEKKEQQFFYFHEAHEWFHYNWSSKLITGVVPTEVPLLEMYFVLFDAKFAHNFFRSILTPEFIKHVSSTGPEYLLCQAAKEWDSSRPGCYLIPTVSSWEKDGREIEKRETLKKKELESLKYFNSNPLFGRWMKASQEWAKVVGNKSLYQIEQACRHLLNSRKADFFNLRACTMKIVLHPH